MKRTWQIAVDLTLAVLVLGGCGRAEEKTTFESTFDFEEGQQGWEAGFADLPAGYDPHLYELASSWEPLPSELEGHGIYLQGHNRSDDLFMFLKLRVDGLVPVTVYQATFAIDLATDSPGGMVGIGGAPGESVYLKAGATAIEPLVEQDTDSWLRLNVDKGQQAQGGPDMVVLGHVAYEPDGTEEAGQYVLKPLDNEDQPLTVTTDDGGAIWLIVGTDSGFEGLTAVYYSQITASLTAGSSE